ncbi:MAG TPA: sigma-70 family RNA polymerase sigma factor, partial [Gemmata sp.]|nr:sigma-70 family RNA polymerase sigma factor [Gemmata sp.]
ESYLRAIVRSQLSNQLQSKFDSVDVVQSVWVQLLQKLEQDGCRINDQNHLRALLVTIARRRLISRARQYSLADLKVTLDDEGWETIFDSRQDMPSETAQANDLWTRMLELTSPEHHKVLILKREGLPLQEIADRTGLHEGSVRRILRKLSRELALQEQPLDPPSICPSPGPQ